MRIENRLDRDTRSKLNILRSHKKKNKKSKKKYQENLSESELRNLMGVNRPTYKRCNGAFRQI